MNVFTEICLYLFVVLGIICSTITIFGNNINYSKKYIRKKEADQNVLVELKFTGVNDDLIQDISYTLANGNFNNIYDLADEFKVYKKDV